MNFSSDAMADFEGLLEVNRKICKQQMAEKASPTLPTNCAVLPLEPIVVVLLPAEDLIQGLDIGLGGYRTGAAIASDTVCPLDGAAVFFGGRTHGDLLACHPPRRGSIFGWRSHVLSIGTFEDGIACIGTGGVAICTKRRYLVVFSTHSCGLALRNSLGAFRHKQDSTLVAEQTTIFSVHLFLRVNM